MTGPCGALFIGFEVDLDHLQQKWIINQLRNETWNSYDDSLENIEITC